MFQLLSKNDGYKKWCLALLILNYSEAQSHECRLQQTQHWTITCSWFIESTWYLSQNIYTCAWYQRKSDKTATAIPAFAATTRYFMPGTRHLYYRWECTMTALLPQTTGRYVYSFQDPSRGLIVAKYLDIRSPEKPVSHSCPQRVLENSRLICNCTTPNSGNPPGILNWPGYTNTRQLIVEKVRRGTQFTCQLQWNGLFANVTYSPQVIYGPSAVRISGPDDFITNGKHILNLTCGVVGRSYPGVTYSWTGVNCSFNHTSADDSTCMFTPVADDDTKIITCTAKNTRSNLSASTSYNLSLQYPPTTSPYVTGYASGQDIISGSSLNISCEVSGGKPLVSSVIFFCGRHSDSADLIRPRSVRSLVFIPNVSPSDNGKLCLCSANWTPQPDLYRSTSEIILSVVDPPTTPPVLSGYTSRDALWEGSSLTLNCTVNGGKPPVLSVNVFCESGVAIQPGTLETRGESVTRSVLLGPLKAADNGINCWCNATWQPEPAYFQNRTSVKLTVFALTEKNAFSVAAIVGAICGLLLILIAVIVIAIAVITKRKRSASSKHAAEPSLRDNERTNNLYGMNEEDNGTIRSPDLSNRNENINQDPTLEYLTAEGAIYSVIKKPSERSQIENGKYSDKNDIRSSATGNINNEEHSVPHHTAVIPPNLGQNFENAIYAVPQKKLNPAVKVKQNLKPKPPRFSSTPAEGSSSRVEGPCVGAHGIPSVSEADYYNICQQSFSMTHSYENVELRPAEINVTSSNITVTKEVTQNEGVVEVTQQGDALQLMQQSNAHQLTQKDGVQEVTQNDGVQEVTQNDGVQEVTQNDGVQEVTQQDDAQQEMQQGVAQQMKQNNDGDEYDVLRLSHNAHEMQLPDPLYNHI